MENTSEHNRKRPITLGILAHVDAGKTTLAESLLYISGSIRRAGRVDHQDAFLDTHDLERARGITIFSKQARFSWQDLDITRDMWIFRRRWSERSRCWTMRCW